MPTAAAAAGAPGNCGAVVNTPSAHHHEQHTMKHTTGGVQREQGRAGKRRGGSWALLGARTRRRTLVERAACSHEAGWVLAWSTQAPSYHTPEPQSRRRIGDVEVHPARPQHPHNLLEGFESVIIRAISASGCGGVYGVLFDGMMRVAGSWVPAAPREGATGLARRGKPSVPCCSPPRVEGSRQGTTRGRLTLRRHERRAHIKAPQEAASH